VLPDWTETRVGLQQAARVIGGARAAVAEPEPNWAHLGLRVVPDGLTTGALPSVGELFLDFKTLAILFNPLEGDSVGFALARHTPVTLADAIENALDTLGYMVTLNRSKITGDKVFNIDQRIASDYARALNMIDQTFQRFRASLQGQKSPTVVWPHGFDLSFLWFATDHVTEGAPHMNFGFSPYSPGLERPYFYTYASPIPDGLTDLDLPPLTRWHTAGWTGTVTEYDDLVERADPVAAIQETLSQIFDTVAPLLDS
jgi:hypothetical protein